MKRATCSKCSKGYLRKLVGQKQSNFVFVYISPSGKLMRGNVCYPCLRSQSRSYYKKRRHYWRDYERTPNGFLMRSYRNMKSRVLGVQWKKAHLYEGKSILPKEEFYAWAKASQEFQSLFKAWKKSGRNRKLTPSVNRKDSKLGYFVANMEWITHSENSRLGAVSRYSR